MNPRRAPTRMPRCASVLLPALLLVACAGHPQKPVQKSPHPAATARAPARTPTRKPWKSLGPYTAGGLYAPGVADGAPDVPPDVASLPEPVPHAEPLSRYGNRSPYVVLGKTYTVLPSASGYLERGVASWYGTKFDGRATSSFEPYDVNQFSAAHRTLPLPSYARVTNLENGRSVIVRINDRGPFHEGRLIDLSYAAAIKLGVNVHGTAKVEVRGIDPGQPLPPAPSAQAIANPRAAPSKPVVVAPKAAAAGPDAQSAAMQPATTAPDIDARASPATETLDLQAIAKQAAAPSFALSLAAPNPVPPQPTDPVIQPSTRGFLQVASYSDRTNAERMLLRLQQAAVDNAELVSVQVGGQILWRVHVGPLTADEAERIAEHLDMLGFGHPPFFKD